MSPVHFELRPDGKGPEERERPTHSYADTCNVFGRRGFQVLVPSLTEIDELGQFQIISPISIADHARVNLYGAHPPLLQQHCVPPIPPHAEPPADRNLFEG